jgi:death-on-curing protein
MVVDLDGRLRPTSWPAALLEFVARFHSLIDGNMRTAWALMVLLPWVNGYMHSFSTEEGFDLLLGVAAGISI